MNFYALTKKYFPDAEVTVEDRTYEGLKWHGPGKKPGLDIFKAFQEEEDRLDRIAGREVRSGESLMQEKQRQARAKAQEDLIPFQEKMGRYYEEERQKFRKLQEDALEVQARLRVKNHAIDCWKEITAAQELLQKQAQEYLEATKHMLAWDKDKIPADVVKNRQDAHKVLEEGALVYADWKTLREAEAPTQEELREALLKGGEHLARVKKHMRELALKYPKPRRLLY